MNTFSSEAVKEVQKIAKKNLRRDYNTFHNDSVIQINICGGRRVITFFIDTDTVSIDAKYFPPYIRKFIVDFDTINEIKSTLKNLGYKVDDNIIFNRYEN